jgi:agmatinase
MKVIPHIYCGIPTFAKAPLCQDLTKIDADIAVLGMPYENTFGNAGARIGPRGIREASVAVSYEMERGYYHPDDDEIYFKGGISIVDCGDVPVVACDLEPSFTLLKDAVRRIAKSDALLITLGGDHSITGGVIEALDERGPFGVIHIDAHMDWNKTDGRKYCQSNPLRLASEMSHVNGMAQLGIRAFPLTSLESLQDARDYGSVILSPKKIRELGIDGTIAALPKRDRYYVTIDIDGMDPSIAPATGALAYGGLLYEETRELLKGIATLGEIVGFDMVEVAPPLDSPGNPTCQLAARLIADFAGFILKEKEAR